MAVDTFENIVSGLNSPARKAITIVPNDGVDLAFTSRSIYVGTSGDVAVHMAGENSPVVFKNMHAGILPVRVDRVLSTGTTAADIVVLW